jgi:hypothetical protein
MMKGYQAISAVLVFEFALSLGEGKYRQEDESFLFHLQLQQTVMTYKCQGPNIRPCKLQRKSTLAKFCPFIHLASYDVRPHAFSSLKDSKLSRFLSLHPLEVQT